MWLVIHTGRWLSRIPYTSMRCGMNASDASSSTHTMTILTTTNTTIEELAAQIQSGAATYRFEER